MPPEPLTFRVPLFGRLADWCGVWAMEPQRAAVLARALRSLDLTAHVRQTQAAPPRPAAALAVPTVQAPNGQRVATVGLTGPLMKAVSSADESGTSTVAARRLIRQAAADPEVGAVLLVIDSPGGTVAGTADLAAEVRAAAKRKPVWAHVQDLGASAAYWVASQADKVYANDRTALVGSIGTLAVVYDLSAAAEAEGVKTLVFGTGPLKGAGVPGAAVTDDQQAYFRAMVEDAQVSFDAAVKAGRGLTDARLEKAKSGGVFGATEALDLGLVDGIKSFDAVLTELGMEARRRQRDSQTTRAAGPTPVRSAAVDETLTVADPAAQTAAPTPAAGPVPVQPTADLTTLRAQHAAELDRIAGIQRVASGHPAIASQAVREGWTVDRAEVAAMKAALPSHVSAAGPHVVSRSHDQDCTVEALQAAMLLRAGVPLDHKAFGTLAAVHMPEWLRAGLNTDARQRRMEAAHQFAGLSAIDLCREAVRLDGRAVPRDRTELIKAAVSGGAMPAIFTTNVNAVLLTKFMEAPDTTGGWTRTSDVADFKTNERVRLQKVGGTLAKLPRGGTADHANRSDLVETYRIARYAEQFVVDEQDFIDDNLGAIQDMPNEMAMKALRLRPDLCYAILLANPTLNATGRPLFNTTDGNLGSTAALSAATLKAASSAMMLGRENAVNLNIMPTHLIVPPTLMWTAKELMHSTQILIAGTAGSVTERGSANVVADLALQIVADARLENGVTDPDTGASYAGSPSTWFLASNQVPTIEVAYLRGTGRMPQVRSFVLDKGSYGIGWDIKYDIGAKALEWRGLRKTTA